MSNNPKIKHGFYNAFYAFKLFDNKGSIDNKEYVKVLGSLRDTGLFISAERPDKEVFFMDSFTELLQKRKEKHRQNKENGETVPSYLQQSIQKVGDNPKIYFGATESGFRIEIEDDLVDDLDVSQDYYINQLVDIYRDEERYTGIASKEHKNRFLLFPPFIRDTQQRSYHPGIYLTIYKHGYAILWLSFELEDIEFNEINLNGWCLDIESAYFPEFMINGNKSFDYKKKARCSNINILLKEYAAYIYKSANYSGPNIPGQYFYHLILSEYAYMMDKYEDKVNVKFSETIYKLLFAPIHDYLLKTPSEIENILNKRYYSNSMYLRFYANNNRVISAYAKDYKKSVKPYLPPDLDLKDTEALNFLYQRLSMGGAINSIESLLLKKETIQNLLVFELNEKTSLKKLINLLIKENLNYSIEFSKYFYTYGSVREMLSFLERSCEDFLQNNLMNERQQKIEKVISLKKEKYNANFTALGPILTIALTLFLSFPTLESIFKIVKRENWLLPTYFTINIIFIIFILYITREQLTEIISDLNGNFILKLKKNYLKIGTKMYIKYIDFAVIMNLEYKTALKIIFNKIRYFRFRRLKNS